MGRSLKIAITLGFLSECDLEPFERKIDEYLKSLQKIKAEKGIRQKKASQLLDRYQKASSLPSHKTNVRAQLTSLNPRPDQKIAKAWEKERTSKQVHFHQPISGTVKGSINTVNGTINGGKVGTINEQENTLLRRTSRKINKVSYTENSNRLSNTSKRTYEELPDGESEIYGDEDDESDEDDEKKPKLEKRLIDDFVLRFKAINTDEKWKLPSDRYVEDVLYDWAVTHRSETLAHSFILDTDCQEIMDLFDLEEKEIIMNTNKKSFPSVQDDIKKNVMKYHKKNVSELRKIVMEPYLKDEEVYNPKLHYDLEWIHLVFNKFVIEWEQGVNALAEDNLEAWIVSHVWTFIIDMALKDIEETKIGKSDGGSSASKMRKNKKRKVGKTIIRGRKIDILLKFRNSSREILAGEVARTGDIHNKKYLGDRIKLLKLMKDMLDIIIESIPPTTIDNYRSLCTFGIQLFKNKGTIYIMDYPGGVIARLTKKAQLESPIYIEGICELILSIITMLELKNAIRGILKIIEKIEDDELEAQVFQKNNSGVQLSLVATTPTPRSSLTKRKSGFAIVYLAEWFDKSHRSLQIYVARKLPKPENQAGLSKR
ncbi:17291_t:CDS:10 [Cetraspora pellucida]|uniref:17291_t:CDS:1 n=1 Tax=Cetraspora pellucida TaxID=1433469 RepID=A0A9N9B6C8_9GLOM|nr:17291_t:CDS:10 [Cetraspora pellucida]